MTSAITTVSDSNRNFQRTLKPSLRLLEIFCQSSYSPIPATAETMRRVVKVATFGRATTRSAAARPVSITTPPIVGVPCLMRCVCGPSSRTNCPNFLVCKNIINFDPKATVTANAIAAARMTLNKSQLLLQPLGQTIQSYTPRPLDDHV